MRFAGCPPSHVLRQTIQFICAAALLLAFAPSRAADVPAAPRAAAFSVDLSKWNELQQTLDAANGAAGEALVSVLYGDLASTPAKLDSAIVLATALQDAAGTPDATAALGKNAAGIQKSSALVIKNLTFAKTTLANPKRKVKDALTAILGAMNAGAKIKAPFAKLKGAHGTAVTILQPPLKFLTKAGTPVSFNVALGGATAPTVQVVNIGGSIGRIVLNSRYAPGVARRHSRRR